MAKAGENIVISKMAITKQNSQNVKSNIKHLYELFATTLMFEEQNEKGCDYQNDQDMQWITIYSSESEDANAKKFIISLCNPDLQHKMKITKDLALKIEQTDLQKNLIKRYQVHLFVENISNSNLVNLTIQGSLEDVVHAKSIIDNELDQLDRMQNSSKQSASDNMGDDDIILLSDCDDSLPSSIKTTNTGAQSIGKKKKKKAHAIKDDDDDNDKDDSESPKEKEIQSSFEKMQFAVNDTDSDRDKKRPLSSVKISTAISVPPPALSNRPTPPKINSTSFLVEAAMEKGFGKKEIADCLQAYKPIGEPPTLNELIKLLNKNNTPSKNETNQINRKNFEKPQYSPWLVEPLNKKMNVSKQTPPVNSKTLPFNHSSDYSECIMLDDIVPNANNAHAIGRNFQLDDSVICLNDYATKFQTDEFESVAQEKENKAKRMQALLSGMNEKSKASAVQILSRQVDARANLVAVSGSKQMVLSPKNWSKVKTRSKSAKSSDEEKRSLMLLGPNKNFTEITDPPVITYAESGMNMFDSSLPKPFLSTELEYTRQETTEGFKTYPNSSIFMQTSNDKNSKAKFSKVEFNTTSKQSILTNIDAIKLPKNGLFCEEDLVINKQKEDAEKMTTRLSVTNAGKTEAKISGKGVKRSAESSNANNLRTAYMPNEHNNRKTNFKVPKNANNFKARSKSSNPKAMNDPYEKNHHQKQHQQQQNNNYNANNNKNNNNNIFAFPMPVDNFNSKNTKTTTSSNASKNQAAKSNSLPSTKASLVTTKTQSSDLRFIVIDGSNVAREHGKHLGKCFSSKGIKIAVDYFAKRGHTQITAMVPRFRRGQSDTDCPTRNPEILDELEEKGYLTYTPSRFVENRLILPYDDRFILKTAVHYNGVVVSNDNYRDLWTENPDWKKLVHTSLLQFTFIGDLFLIADDPLGRGSNLDDFLSVSRSANKLNNNPMSNRNVRKQY